MTKQVSKFAVLVALQFVAITFAAFPQSSFNSNTLENSMSHNIKIPLNYKLSAILYDPPREEEIDHKISRKPWTRHLRLTEEAFRARCAMKRIEFRWADYHEHLKLSPIELQLLHDMMRSLQEIDMLQLGPKFVVRNHGNKPRVCEFDEQGNLQTQSFADFRNSVVEKFVETKDRNGKYKRSNAGDYFLLSPLTKRYDHVEYRPGVRQEDMPEGVLNLCRGWPGLLKPGWEDRRIGPDGLEPVTNGPFDGPEIPRNYCDLFLDHMQNNVCGGDEQVMHYICGWIADSFWNPGPSDVAIVLRGLQGSGKTFWVERIMEFFGIHAITLDDDSQLLGNFNTHLMNKSLVFADEAFFAGNRRHAAKLKTMVTKPDLFIEPKGVDGFVRPKQFRLIMASNDDHVIRAEGDDRRYLVLDVDAGDHNQDAEYFSNIAEEWRRGGRTAFFRWLTGAWWGRAVGNGQFRSWPRPTTAALQEQKDLSLPPALLAIHNMLRDGEVPCDHAVNKQDGSVFVPTTLLLHANRLGMEHQRALGDVLRVLAGKTNGPRQDRHMLGFGRDRRQHRGAWLPPLDECRRRWEQHLCRTVQWPYDVTSWAIDENPADEQDMPF